MKMKKKSAAEQADANLEAVSIKSGEKTVLKKGSHVEHSQKHLATNTIGASVGSTLNMGDYESLRIDVWASVEVGDKPMDDAYAELFGILDKKLKDAVAYYTEK